MNRIRGDLYLVHAEFWDLIWRVLVNVSSVSVARRKVAVVTTIVTRRQTSILRTTCAATTNTHRQHHEHA
jgi:hypothetical protein